MSFGSIEMASAYDELSDPQFTHGKELIGLLGIGGGDRVLDIGCGTGRLAAFTVERVGVEGRVIGIDPAPPRIQVAQERGDPRLEFCIGGAQDLSQFPDGSFDVAYLNSVVSWIRDKPSAFGEAYRVLKSGGRLGIGTTVRERPNQLRVIKRRAWMTMRGISGRTEQNSSRGSDKIGSEYAATATEIRAMLEDAGFVPRILEVRTFISLFRNIAQIVDFLQATGYGDLAPGATAADSAAFRGALEALFASEYADRVSSDGIRLERYVLLAVADKPA
jgi:ubiquinone/menaquinone biosynthesis C-methylase UbiE